MTVAGSDTAVAIVNPKLSFLVATHRAPLVDCLLFRNMMAAGALRPAALYVPASVRVRNNVMCLWAFTHVAFSPSLELIRLVTESILRYGSKIWNADIYVTSRQDSQVIVTVRGTLLCARSRMCDAMKLMGTSMLSKLAARARSGIPCGAVAALRAELEAATWDGPSDVHDQYPLAVIDDNVITIPLGDEHCVSLVANYKSAMIVIEFAGSVRTRGEIAVGRKP